MDASRFDSLTKRLGMRRSRRDAVRAGVVVAAGAALLTREPRARAQEATPVALDTGTTAADRFVAIAYFPYEGSFGDASEGLKPLLRLMQQQPGFITMSLIHGDEQIYLVTWFLDKATSDAGMRALDGWIGVDEQGYLSGDSQRTGGEVFLRSELGTGCACTLDDEDACGNDDLYCCTLPDDDRGYCLTSNTTCPVPQDDSETEDDPTATPAATATATSIPACTSEGCECVAGIDGSCDDGLSCCREHDLGGAGVCLSSCPCGGEGCACIGSVVNTCDDGLICCAPGEIGGAGTCQYACTCTSEGCACTVGLDGACDDDLSCCGIGSSAPGSIGACLSACATSSPCPGAEDCECGTLFWACNDGLVCCGATDDGETGICMTEC